MTPDVPDITPGLKGLLSAWLWDEEHADDPVPDNVLPMSPTPDRPRDPVTGRFESAGDPPPDHGTDARYVSGCRCDVCKAGHAAYFRAWRRKRRERETAS